MDDDAQQRHRDAVLATLAPLDAHGGNFSIIAAHMRAFTHALFSGPPGPVADEPAPEVQTDPAEQGPSNAAEYTALSEAAQRAPVPLPGDQQANDQTAFQDTVAAEAKAAG